MHDVIQSAAKLALTSGSFAAAESYAAILLKEVPEEKNLQGVLTTSAGLI